MEKNWNTIFKKSQKIHPSPPKRGHVITEFQIVWPVHSPAIYPINEIMLDIVDNVKCIGLGQLLLFWVMLCWFCFAFFYNFLIFPVYWYIFKYHRIANF